ncbi:MAG: hypothetical protein A3D35_01700 [Candidatus Staskawiczbacteria bacterium RIFCSPHIGHO2_02_FULL_34_9]|uniref:Uncharacterized protein n=1 Tax=Candidatus Staskawiczbacteria bacterium RIFCSPHIGHO2_02_FULL_34_9 TaxID=1802206 RepID=A0A1G2HXZ3_9BACT|nr:MAG: hypothetical protein A3D35_01700 [Candidatus Staskawiczbacteria bacterium RIFCSPHIGHO2_02_FULL_34_9]
MKKTKTIWNWTISREELRNQVENYQDLKITKSYKRISVLIVSILLGFSIILALFGVYANIQDILYSLIIYIPILIFVYRGHRWAIITLIILWTVEKGYQLMLVGNIAPIIWWIIVMPYFYKALQVENERKRNIN